MIQIPKYIFKCYGCDEEVEEVCTISKRSEFLKCSKCGKKIFQHFGGRKTSNGFKDSPRESLSMGVDVSQIPEAMKRFPGSRYNPKTGALKIQNRTEKKVRMRQRNYCEYA